MRLNPFNNLFRADSIPTSLTATVLASGGSRAIGLVRGIVLAWLIPQGEFGLFGVAQLIANVLLPLCSLGLYEGVARYAPLHESAGNLDRFTRRVCLLLALIALPGLVVLYLLAEPVGALLFSNAQLTQGVAMSAESAQGFAGLTRSVVVCVLALIAYQTLLGLLKGLRMFRALATAELLSALLFTGLAITAACVGYDNASDLMLVYAGSCIIPVLLIVPGLLMGIRLLSTGPREEGRRPKTGLIAYSGWMATTAVMWHALSYYPMWHLLKVSDGETVGTFHAMRIITQLIQVSAAMLIAVVGAHVTRLWEHEGRLQSRSRLDALTKAVLLLLLVGATLLSIARPAVMRLFPSAFAAGGEAYDPLVLFFLMVGVAGLIAIRLNLLELPFRVSVAWIVGAAVNVIVSNVLLPITQSADAPSSIRALQSAAWAGVAGVTVAVTLCVAFAHRCKLGLDRPAIVLVIACFSVGFGWHVSLAVALLLLVMAMWTKTIFGNLDRDELRDCLNLRKCR